MTGEVQMKAIEILDRLEKTVGHMSTPWGDFLGTNIRQSEINDLRAALTEIREVPHDDR